MSRTVAAPIAMGAAIAPTDSEAPIPAAVGERTVAVGVVAPEVIDQNSVLPIAWEALLSRATAPIFSAGSAVHSAQVFSDPRFVARL